MYAMVDKEDDLKIGVKSTAILFADKVREIIGLLQLLVVVLLIIIGQMQMLGTAYYLGLFLASGLFIYQQILIVDQQKSCCFKAFLNSHYFGMVVFIGLVVDYGFI
jgi:4-hydroxybenzoate polyprenyltransferase